MTVDTYDYTGFYTIVLTEYTDDLLKTIGKILKDCWSLYIANANILSPTQDYQTVHLYTYFPYTSEHCGGVVPMIYDHFVNGSFVQNITIFPNKLDNLFECPLVISTYNFPPLVILKPQSNGTYFLDGIEGTVLRVIAKRMNFTPVVALSRTNILNKIVSNGSKNMEIDSQIPRSLDLV